MARVKRSVNARKKRKKVDTAEQEKQPKSGLVLVKDGVQREGTFEDPRRGSPH